MSTKTTTKKPAALAVTTVKPTDLATVPAPNKSEIVAAMVELKRRDAEEFNKTQKELRETLKAKVQRMTDKAYSTKRASMTPRITWSSWEGVVTINVRYEFSDKSPELIKAIKDYDEANKFICFDEKECTRQIREALDTKESRVALILSNSDNVTKLKALMEHVGL